MVGITRYGGYVPRLRLSRKAAVEANGWFNPALKGLAKGTRSMCNWDEDTLTMAVEAARDCLNGAPAEDFAAVHLASTSLPFEDRQNAGILANALNMDEAIQAMDVAASQRAGTTGLINALNAVTAQGGRALYIASEHRATKAAGPQELQYGDGAAAFVLSGDDVAAEFVGSHQIAVDFVDHFRGQNEPFDYNWEERWIRDEGYLKIVPRALDGLFAKTKAKPDEVDHFILPGVIRGLQARIANAAGIPDGAVRDPLHANMGEAGTAHPLMMLAELLEEAEPGKTILLVGWGQGCDALLFRTTDKVKAARPRLGIKGHLARGREETNYNRYLAFNGLIEQDKGIRSEVDSPGLPSAMYRKRDMVTGFVGGKCRKCGTAQFPKSHVCVNPNCGAFHTQDPLPFADIPAKIQSWTADNLTYSPDPPAHFGMVVFAEGGRMMADITDVDAGAVEVGMPMRMVFRIKHFDDRRGMTKYFWKAAPDQAQD